MHLGADQQTGRVGDNMTLAGFDFLGRIKAARYPLSPRIGMLRGILAKFGPMGPAPDRRHHHRPDR
jgi:hypothetical protein